MKEQLDTWAAKHPNRLKLVHVVGMTPDAPAPAGWETTATYTVETGWIDEAKIQKYAHPPAADTMVFVCGIPMMYSLLCGPRNEKELAEGTVLHKLGYDSAMVAKM